MMTDIIEIKGPRRNYLVLVIGIYLLLSGILQLIITVMNLSSPIIYFTIANINIDITAIIVIIIGYWLVLNKNIGRLLAIIISIINVLSTIILIILVNIQKQINVSYTYFSSGLVMTTITFSIYGALIVIIDIFVIIYLARKATRKYFIK
jgi:hypothetical protein